MTDEIEAIVDEVIDVVDAKLMAKNSELCTDDLDELRYFLQQLIERSKGY
tara:strand:+ start:403 stop:552 length:150 start_codon:yes stop_codon:yes gene_type:complete